MLDPYHILLGNTVTKTAQELFIDYDQPVYGFASVADLELWCNTFGINYTITQSPTGDIYTFKKAN